jgi:hypothetical protein
MRSGKNVGFCARRASDMAAGILQRSLQLVDHGPKCTVGNILLVLFFAAARVSSIYDACRRLSGAPTDQAVRDALDGMLPKQMPALERRLNLALADGLPRRLMNKARPVAIDTHGDPYYGEPHKRARELRRGKRQRGTSRFHCYATLCVLHKGRRYTVAATYVWRDDSYERVVRRLLERARETGLKVRYLLLDRAFYSLAVVQSLQSARCPFLMPVVHRGRRPKGKTVEQLKRLKGTRRFLAWRRSGFSEHQMDNRKAKTGVKVAVACRTRRTRGGKVRRQAPLVFAFWGFRPSSPAWAAERYRERFGIESSYRQLNQGRARTCCRDPRIRLLLVVLALVLRNLWVWIHDRVLGLRRGAGIQLRLHLLRFRTLLLMLQRCAEQTFGCAETASTLISPSARLLEPRPAPA